MSERDKSGTVHSIPSAAFDVHVRQHHRYPALFDGWEQTPASWYLKAWLVVVSPPTHAVALVSQLPEHFPHRAEHNAR